MVMRLEDVKLDTILVRDRIRTSLSETTIRSLMESMKVIGLINPVMITRPRMQPVLIAGAHRLEAARRLGWTSIKCMVAPSIEEDDAKLAEIDENLIRTDLTPAERALSISMRKEIYERKHPETVSVRKRGGPGRGKKKTSPEPGLVLESVNANEAAEAPNQQAEPFIDDTAKKTGKGRSTVALDAKRAEDIPQIADVIGTSLDKGDELDALGKMTPEQQAEIIDKAKSGKKVSAKAELKKSKRDDKVQELAQVTAQIAEKIGHQVYNVILADPPWRFEPYSRETGMDRAADNHYPTESTESIKALDVQNAASDDCVLFLWATVPMLPEAMEVMEAWGFDYKSLYVWGKNRIGTGYWSRNNAELLLIGVRGEIPAPAPGTQPETLIMAPVGKHSAKPEVFYEIIERMYPTVPKLEMFARTNRDGWDSWGNEAPTEEAA